MVQPFPHRTPVPSLLVDPSAAVVGKKVPVVAIPAVKSGQVKKSDADAGDVALPEQAWPSPLNATPNAFLRSALFGCHAHRSLSEKALPHRVDHESRVTLDTAVHPRKWVVAASDQYKIEFDGDRLNQFDSTVWQLAIQTAKASGNLGARISFSFNEWNKALGRAANSGKNNDSIKESLERLFRSYIKVTVSGRYVRRQRFLDEFDEDLKANRFYLRINPEMAPLFEGDATEIDLHRRARLHSSLSQWLHDFYSTHGNPIPISLANLKTWSGSEQSLNKNFNVRLRAAITELMTCENPLFDEGTRIDNGTLFVVKKSNSKFLPPIKTEVEAVPSATVAAVTSVVVRA